MIIAIVNKETNEFKVVSANSFDDVEYNKETEYLREFDINTDLGNSDIRVYNDDNSIKSIGQQIKEGIKKLEKDEIIRYGQIQKINMSFENEKVKAIQRGLIELSAEQELVYDSTIKNYVVSGKSVEKKYIEGLIGDEKYNEAMIQNRQGSYWQTDNLFIDFMIKYIDEIKHTLPPALQKEFEAIIEKKKEIKAQYPKTTDDSFAETLERKLNLESVEKRTFNINHDLIKQRKMEVKSAKRKTK